MKASDKELLLWAENEIRELDELCRSMVPGYESLGSTDILKLRRIKALGEEPEEPTTEEV